MEDVLLVIAAGGALFNSWQIARLAGRVDAMESTMQTVLTLLAGRASESPHRPTALLNGVIFTAGGYTTRHQGTASTFSAIHCISRPPCSSRPPAN